MWVLDQHISKEVCVDIYSYIIVLFLCLKTNLTNNKLSHRKEFTPHTAKAATNGANVSQSIATRRWQRHKAKAPVHAQYDPTSLDAPNAKPAMLRSLRFLVSAW